MIDFLLAGNNISKSFVIGREIFSGINFELSNNNSIGLAGENGSGKTTLMKILAGLILPSKGNILLKINSKEEKRDNFFSYIGYVAPYLFLYEEFTPLEHLKLTANLRGDSFDLKSGLELLRLFHLYDRQDDQIRTFSSGMKQRMKYILAIENEPLILFLDEPFTNLDNDGIKIVQNIILEHLNNGGGVVIASNDDREKELCSSIITLK